MHILLCSFPGKQSGWWTRWTILTVLTSDCCSFFFFSSSSFFFFNSTDRIHDLLQQCKTPTSFHLWASFPQSCGLVSVIRKAHRLHWFPDLFKELSDKGWSWWNWCRKKPLNAAVKGAGTPPLKFSSSDDWYSVDRALPHLRRVWTLGFSTFKLSDSLQLLGCMGKVKSLCRERK